MGFSSWLTADTKESIPNIHSGRPMKTVYLLQPHGQPAIKLDSYNGYGKFGDFSPYEWLAKMNAAEFKIDISQASSEQLWEIGLHIKCDRKRAAPYPLKFSFDPDAVYEDLEPSKDCPHQGFFYDF